jgi:hypothetical protein
MKDTLHERGGIAMPYADPEARKRVKRESAQRTRAAAHARTRDLLSISPHLMEDESAPAVPPVPCVDPVDPASVTLDDLLMAGRLLGVREIAGDRYESYRQRVRERWATILRVVGE